MDTVTNSITFADLQFAPARNGFGVRAVHKFDNGYGVSVVQSQFSYGGERGLYELAVTNDDGLCYDTPVTDDVEGYLSEAAVTKLLQQVEALEEIANG